MSLDSEVRELQSRLDYASRRLSTLGSESKQVIDAELWVLYGALQKAATDTIKLITESKKTKNLLLFRTNRSIAKKLSTQLTIVIQSLDDSIASSDKVLALSMHHVKQVEDFKNGDLFPMKQKVRITIKRVEYKKTTATVELNQKRSEASQAASDLSRTARQLEQKQSELSSNRYKLSNKQQEVRNAEAQQVSYERQSRDYRDRASAAEQKAHRLRKRAAWTTVLTLGIGLPVAATDMIRASNENSNARTYSSQARSSASHASSLRGTCYSIERQIQNLETESRSLESQKSSLEWRKERYRKEVQTLESSVAALGREVRSANSLAADLASVDSKTDDLSERTRLLSRSLQQLKADISTCLETLTEQRDFGELTARKASRSYISDEQRLKLLESAGQVLPRICDSQRLISGADPRATDKQNRSKGSRQLKPAPENVILPPRLALPPTSTIKTEAPSSNQTIPRQHKKLTKHSK